VVERRQREATLRAKAAMRERLFHSMKTMSRDKKTAMTMSAMACEL
jgi:hypothetical protein